MHCPLVSCRCHCTYFPAFLHLMFVTFSRANDWLLWEAGCWTRWAFGLIHQNSSFPLSDTLHFSMKGWWSGGEGRADLTSPGPSLLLFQPFLPLGRWEAGREHNLGTWRVGGKGKRTATYWPLAQNLIQTREEPGVELVNLTSQLNCFNPLKFCKVWHVITLPAPLLIVDGVCSCCLGWQNRVLLPVSNPWLGLCCLYICENDVQTCCLSFYCIFLLQHIMQSTWWMWKTTAYFCDRPVIPGGPWTGWSVLVGMAWQPHVLYWQTLFLLIKFRRRSGPV